MDEDQWPAGDTEPREEPDEPAEPRGEVQLPEPPHTGDPVVDQVTATVAAAAAEPPEAQVAIYDDAHRTLQDRLADVES